MKTEQMLTVVVEGHNNKTPKSKYLIDTYIDKLNSTPKRNVRPTES